MHAWCCTHLRVWLAAKAPRCMRDWICHECRECWLCQILHWALSSFPLESWLSQQLFCVPPHLEVGFLWLPMGHPVILCGLPHRMAFYGLCLLQDAWQTPSCMVPYFNIRVLKRAAFLSVDSHLGSSICHTQLEGFQKVFFFVVIVNPVVWRGLGQHKKFLGLVFFWFPGRWPVWSASKVHLVQRTFWVSACTVVAR